MIWLCRDCDAYVGCHKNTKTPKGRFLADKNLREARKLAHAIIDPLWREKGYSRKEVYIRLSDAFGYEIHIGDTETPEQCEEIIRTAELLFNQ